MDTKIATTIEEGRYFLNIGIDPNSADMCWCIKKLSWGESNTLLASPILDGQDINTKFSEYVPAWSLQGLLNLLPTFSVSAYGGIYIPFVYTDQCFTPSIERKNDFWVCKYVGDTVPELLMFDAIGTTAVDAVIDMILHLKKEEFPMKIQPRNED